MHDFLGNAVLLTAISVASAVLFTRLFNYLSPQA